MSIFYRSEYSHNIILFFTMFVGVWQSANLGCARFPEFLQNFSKRQILWSLCLVVFHVFTLKLPIQISISMGPGVCSFSPICAKF